MNESATNKVFTIPNLLTVLRLLLLPVFWVLLVVYKENLLSFLVLLVAALTDLIDGFIARSTHTVSRLGQQLDPAVDRIFIVVCIVAVFVVGRVPLWILVVLLARDASMLVLAIYQKRRFRRDFEVIFLGKLTTALLMAGFCSLVLWWPILPGATVVESGLLPGWGVESAPLGSWLLYAGVLCSIGAALFYLYRGTRPNKGERIPLSLSTTAAPASPPPVNAETGVVSASLPGEGDRL
ncbi:MAG: CDP-alcohol phosphatidyltransferase family protein [Coriobacteriales bacterium]|jgi:cardiolipin synthase|nr:CDP-alcohol phosphatidyltransferase family protein [Coriobacteriales bacterium]